MILPLSKWSYLPFIVFRLEDTTASFPHFTNQLNCVSHFVEYEAGLKKDLCEVRKTAPLMYFEVIFLRWV